jgi:broad specificity phosphatase PhoE
MVRNFVEASIAESCRESPAPKLPGESDEVTDAWRPDGSKAHGYRRGEAILEGYHGKFVTRGARHLDESRLLLMRHAETAAPDFFHGAESDIGLSTCGDSQSVIVAQFLRNEAANTKAIYSSGMSRAIATARPIADTFGLDLQVVELLHERKIGPLSGQPREQGWETYTEVRRAWIAGNLDATHEGGESFADIQRRVLPAFEMIANRHRGETIVVVVHGVVIRVILCSILPNLGPADFDRVAIDFASVNDLRFDGRSWRAERLNWVLSPSQARPVA